jgi:hypothetical protein
MGVREYEGDSEVKKTRLTQGQEPFSQEPLLTPVWVYCVTLRDVRLTREPLLRPLR